MSTPTPSAKFLDALDIHIEARIAKATLQFERMPARSRDDAQVLADKHCEDTKADLATATTDLLKDARRPGI